MAGAAGCFAAKRGGTTVEAMFGSRIPAPQPHPQHRPTLPHSAVEGVLEGKFVVTHSDGSVEWEPGSNRAIVRGSGEPSTQPPPRFGEADPAPLAPEPDTEERMEGTWRFTDGKRYHLRAEAEGSLHILFDRGACGLLRPLGGWYQGSVFEGQTEVGTLRLRLDMALDQIVLDAMEAGSTVWVEDFVATREDGLLGGFGLSGLPEDDLDFVLTGLPEEDEDLLPTRPLLPWRAEAIYRRKLDWARIRDWICVHTLVAVGRAFPRYGAPVPPLAGPCASWDEDGATDAALAAPSPWAGAAAKTPTGQALAAIRRHPRLMRTCAAQIALALDGSSLEEDFGRLAAALVLLPAHLLVRILQYQHSWY